MSTNDRFHVDLIPVEDTYPLRLLVLRPGGVVADCYFEGDRDFDTFHSAFFEGKQILSVASFLHRTLPEIAVQPAIQLRGMATHPDYRQQGLGKILVEDSVRRSTELGYRVMWCNAREIAVPFYEKLGFKITGQPFEVPKIGRHYVMVKNLNA